MITRQSFLDTTKHINWSCKKSYWVFSNMCSWLGRGGCNIGAQNPGIVKIGLRPPATPSNGTLADLTTKVYNWPSLGVNYYFLDKYSLIVVNDRFWGICAHFSGDQWSLFWLSYQFGRNFVHSAKESWQGSDPLTLLGSARILSKNVTAPPLSYCQCFVHTTFRWLEDTDGLFMKS